MKLFDRRLPLLITGFLVAGAGIIVSRWLSHKDMAVSSNDVTVPKFLA